MGRSEKLVHPRCGPGVEKVASRGYDCRYTAIGFKVEYGGVVRGDDSLGAEAWSVAGTVAKGVVLYIDKIVS